MSSNEFLAGPGNTPDSKLAPLGSWPRVPIAITINVPVDWKSRLDMQWVVEREIHADRWSWSWPKSA